jgi:hypothetical protein
MTQPGCGEKCDVTIKNVRVVGHPSARLVRIADEHGDTYDMPPQAAITRPGEFNDTRIAAALTFLDNLETEQCLQPHVAATVRKVLGLPPRHWPPQAGDVWDDGMPWDSLWFARAYPQEGENDAWPERTYVVMTNVRGGGNIKSPPELLASVREVRDDLTLVYRHKDGGQ